jgi:hypothetical protein
LPPLAARFTVPVASGVGSGDPTVPPDPSSTRYRLPGATLPARVVGDHEVPVAVAYWIDQPVRSMLALLRLKSST